MAGSRFESDMYVNGILQAKQLVPSAGCILDQHINGGAGINPSKMGHRHEKTYGQPGGAISFTERKVIHVVYGATGLVLAFRAGLKSANVGAATVTFDLQVNGVSILSAVITITNSTLAYALVAATITTPALVAGNVLEAVIVATAGGGTIGNGAFCQLVENEDAS